MSNKEQLRAQRENTIINTKSKKEDRLCIKVVNQVIDKLKKELHIRAICEKRIYLVDIIRKLKKAYPEVKFAKVFDSSYMTPDGGVTYLLDNNDKKYPLLIAEVKNQGTNDTRLLEGKKKQAQGNAVERLGKNVIGFRTYLMTETIFPFVCFGDGCDFDEGSSILDRVKTIAMYGELNVDHTTNEGINSLFNRGSYYFRKDCWTEKEMFNILYKVAKRSVYYYYSKYGEENFIQYRLIK